MENTGIIDRERVGTWTAAAFVVALLALVMGIVAVYRTNVLLYGTQIEVLALNKKVENMAHSNAPAPTAAPLASAAAPK